MCMNMGHVMGKLKSLDSHILIIKQFHLTTLTALSKTEIKINPARKRLKIVEVCVCNVGTLHTCIPLRNAPDTLPTIEMIKRGPNELFFHAADQGKTWCLWTWRLLPVSIGQLEASGLNVDGPNGSGMMKAGDPTSPENGVTTKSYTPKWCFFRFFLKGIQV